MAKNSICKVVEVLPPMKNPIPGPAGGPMMPAAEGFKLLVDSWLEYKKVKENETTKREAIRAHRDVAIERINAQKEVFQNVINHTFAERAKNFDHFFATLDKGIEEKNDQIINGAMQMIVNQMQTSPLAGMNEFMAMINNPDVDAIEI